MRSFRDFALRFQNDVIGFSKLPVLVQEMVRTTVNMSHMYPNEKLAFPMITSDYSCGMTQEIMYNAMAFLWAEEFRTIELYDSSTGALGLLYRFLMMNELYNGLPFSCSVNNVANHEYRDCFNQAVAFQGIVMKMTARTGGKVLRGDEIK